MNEPYLLHITAFGQGYMPIGDKVEYKLEAPNLAKIPETFDGVGSVHVDLKEDPSVPHNVFELSLSTPIILSQIKFEMPSDKAAFNITISSMDTPLQYSNDWSVRGVSDDLLWSKLKSCFFVEI